MTKMDNYLNADHQADKKIRKRENNSAENVSQVKTILIFKF